MSLITPDAQGRKHIKQLRHRLAYLERKVGGRVLDPTNRAHDIFRMHLREIAAITWALSHFEPFLVVARKEGQSCN